MDKRVAYLSFFSELYSLQFNDFIMRSVLLIFAALIIVCSCQSGNKIKTKSAEEGARSPREIILTDNDFGISLFQEIAASQQDVNVFISPASISIALAMTYNGAGGATKAAMENTLMKSGFTPDDINRHNRNVIDTLMHADPKVQMEIANAIWYRNDFKVLAEFVAVNHSYYRAQVNAADFGDPATGKKMNDWVKENTHGKIAEIVDQITRDAVMYLINAVYFKGVWQEEFDAKRTQNLEFTTGRGAQLTVPMMQKRDSFRYMHHYQLAGIELPYGAGNFSMIVLLPDHGLSLKQAIDSLTSERLDSILHKMDRKEVILALPRFRFEYTRSLNDDLLKMGMGIAFSEEADFSGINKTGGIMISEVLHKTFVEVNEEGTEAAAVTAVKIVKSSFREDQQPVYFTADHPFIFIICEKNTGSVVFIGCLNNPA